MSRVEVTIDEEACAAVMRRHGLATAEEAVDFALRAAAREAEDEAAAGKREAEAMTLEEALAMRGYGWHGDLDEMRAARFP